MKVKEIELFSISSGVSESTVVTFTQIERKEKWLAYYRIAENDDFITQANHHGSRLKIS